MVILILDGARTRVEFSPGDTPGYQGHSLFEHLPDIFFTVSSTAFAWNDE